MGVIRVLIVDDSVVVRRLVSDVIGECEDLEVAGIAANGRLALSRIPLANPDVVVLDVEMPELDGLETLVEIRKLYPRLPVIMFSSLTERGATTTLDALTRGASDYVTKPTSLGGMGSASEQVRSQLVPKIRALCRQEAGPAPSFRRAAVAESENTGTGRISIVAIGTSTGGPNALGEVLPALPGDFPVPIVVTQHMPPMFTRLLAERLNSKCALQVHEAESGMMLKPGSIWIAPGDFHLAFEANERGVMIKLNQAPPECACRPSVDVMFRSVVGAYGGNTLAVVLTGMGVDGLRGAGLIRQSGGRVFAQDEETSVVWGMPGAVARGGLANRVLPLAHISRAITDAVLLSGKRDSATGVKRESHAHRS